MQAWYDARFERDMGCTEADWLRWLPGAVGPNALQRQGNAAEVSVGTGHLRLAWQVLPDRQMALMRLPRLAVSFHFSGVAAPERQAFMRHFDLYTQRGGG